MLNELNLTNFRGFRTLSLNKLSNINLITGDNNSGKTAILEALYALFSFGCNKHDHLPSAFRNKLNSQGDFECFWLWLFFNKNFQSVTEVNALEDAKSYILKFQGTPKDDNSCRHIHFEFSESSKNGRQLVANFHKRMEGGNSGSFPRNWPTISLVDLKDVNPIIDADKYNRVTLKKGKEDLILSLMKKFDSRINCLRYHKSADQALVYIDIGLDELIPSSQMGQAFCKLFSIYMEILNSGSKILLLDEIENGIHRQKMSTVWESLVELSRSSGVQIFATTHSKECITAAYEAASSNEGAFSQHKLTVSSDGTTAVSSGEVLDP